VTSGHRRDPWAGFRLGADRRAERRLFAKPIRLVGDSMRETAKGSRMPAAPGAPS